MSAETSSAAVSLREWAVDLEAAAGIARAIVYTPFVPDQLRVWLNPHERDPAKKTLDHDATVATVSAVLLAGQELALPPMAALRAFTVIRGTVAMYAVAARALLLSHGHEIVVRESTSTRAIVDARRAGADQWQRSTWDLDRAKTAKLYPGKEDGNWRTQTKSMLVARATAEGSRWVAADAMMGLPVLAEEIEDGELAAIANTATGPEGAPADANGGKRTTKRKTPAARAALPAGPPLPTAEQPPPSPAQQAAQRAKVSKAQQARIHAA